MNRMYGFDPYHVLIILIGASLLLANWLPRLAFRRPPAASALLMLFGMLGVLWFPESFAGLDPITAPELWETSAEIVVIVVLFSTGLRIDNLGAVLGWAMAGMTVAGAVLLGAVLAPTDPVLAGDVQVGPPLEGREHPVRFALTTEAGLNDGLAFPFVYLALHLAVEDWDSALLAEWLAWDVTYRIGVGVALGAAVGWVLGQALFRVPSRSTLAETGTGILSLAAVLLAYGLVEIAEGYGFIAAFVAGVAVRRVEREHPYHKRLHSFSEALEDAVTGLLLVLLGAAMPVLWPYLTWQHSVIGFGLIFLIRPLAGSLGLIGSELNIRERAVVALYGVRGIGSVYYLGYAATHVEFVDKGALWALATFTIFASTIVHGLTAAETVRVLVRE
jgi:sodium/hydrogen antiporter